MSFLIRSVKSEDLSQLTDLARQFTLLNLPADKKIIGEKIERSLGSFSGELKKHEAEYLFVIEDTVEDLIVGSSLIMAKHGTKATPHSYFKVLEKNHVSKGLGIGFIHKVLSFHSDTDGPTEIGGLLVNKQYRKRPEKLGKQISLSRFLYMGMFPQKFEKRILCELAPPLGDDGRSEFWEALGRRFTGLPYQEADLLSQTHKEFIASLFPSENIYLCLLDAKARLVLGRVGEETKPAQQLVESIGFRYIEEVDPFDGGPHFAVDFKEALPIKQGKKLRASIGRPSHGQHSLVGFMAAEDDFHAALVECEAQGDKVIFNEEKFKELELETNQEIFLAPFQYPRPPKEQT